MQAIMKKAKFTPLPNETIRDWTERYALLFRKKPDHSYMRRTSWPYMSVASNMQLNSSQTLQNALAVLKEVDPQANTYYWPGQLQIWFNTDADAVMAKLRMNQ